MENLLGLPLRNEIFHVSGPAVGGRRASHFAALKSPEAKARNLRRAMSVLSGAEARFMARTWKSGK
jgi:hypothetical protein